MKFLIALWMGKLINVLISIIDNTRGSNFAGEKAMKIDPMMIKHFKGIDPSKVTFITGTNGKSTTNNLVNHVLKANGYKVCSNLEGANLLYGVCTALIKGSDLFGRVKADYYIFETDERYIGKIRQQLPAANIVVTNLQKDQVQRNGDPDFIYRKIRDVVKNGDANLFLNNNDPRSSGLKQFGKKVVTYGADRNSMSFTKDPAKYATMPCPVCHHSIEVDYYNTDGLGKFHCTNCDHKSADTADYETQDVDFENRSYTIHGVKYPMPYDLPHMVFNYSCVTAVCKEIAGITEEQTAEALKSFKNINGRNETLHYKGKSITYMRFKQENPETLQTVFNLIAADPTPKALFFGLYPVEDITPFYTNTFYLWDCDASKALAANVEKYYCYSNVVCYDTANWLMLQGVDRDKIVINEISEIPQILEAMESVETDNIYMLTILGDFEKMQKYLGERK